MILLLRFNLILILSILICSCENKTTIKQTVPAGEIPQSSRSPDPEKPQIPILQSEILDEKDSRTTSPLGKFDFKNFTYPLPRGWQDADSRVVTLRHGIRRMTKEKIGMSYVTAKYDDLTGDGVDEAFVILKVRTGSITIPQIVYIFEWRDTKPNLLWYFRTGDRAKGGLKRIYVENGELVVELFGRDRYIFAQTETSEIVGDKQQLCCPSHFTKTRYKKIDRKFVLQGDRLTYSLSNKDAPPVRNMNEAKLREERGPKR